jgi:hypothetical protein
MKPNIVEFGRLVREFVSGNSTWNEVHNYAVEMEWTNALDFPPDVKKPLEALHIAFLCADEGDDPQFRLDRSEVSRLVDDLNRAAARGPSA